MADVDVRLASATEEPGRTLLAGFEQEIAARYPGWDPSQPPTATAGEIEPPSGCFVVAYVDGEPVGCGALKRLDDEAAEIKRIFVAPSARGAGVARGILSALEDAARDRGYSTVRLDTGARQPDAVALFRSSGYAEVGDYNGNRWATYWFEKRLDPRGGAREQRQ